MAFIALSFAPVSIRVHEKVVSLSYHAILIFKQLIFFSKAHFPANVFHEITRITDASKKNALDHNEQTTDYTSVNFCTVSDTQSWFDGLLIIPLFYLFTLRWMLAKWVYQWMQHPFQLSFPVQASLQVCV